MFYHGMIFSAEKDHRLKFQGLLAAALKAQEMGLSDRLRVFGDRNSQRSMATCKNLVPGIMVNIQKTMENHHL